MRASERACVRSLICIEVYVQKATNNKQKNTPTWCTSLAIEWTVNKKKKSEHCLRCHKLYTWTLNSNNKSLTNYTWCVCTVRNCSGSVSNSKINWKLMRVSKVELWVCVFMTQRRHFSFRISDKVKSKAVHAISILYLHTEIFSMITWILNHTATGSNNNNNKKSRIFFNHTFYFYILNYQSSITSGRFKKLIIFDKRFLFQLFIAFVIWKSPQK